MRRGDVYWAELTPRSGSEQTGRRPVVLVSHDAFQQTAGWMSIIVVPITTSVAQVRHGPSVVRIPAGMGGLSKNSAAICHQITTLDRSKLRTKIGALPHEILEEIAGGLKAAMDLD
ncbi:MAG: type II toxin-antitoxin system PemK/MazF family toxin [Bryobacterales bacterium]|nr:type II toxin-antitoxin system PemK/MazF family toxin [Bryobacterales bacterium]